MGHVIEVPVTDVDELWPGGDEVTDRDRHVPAGRALDHPAVEKHHVAPERSNEVRDAEPAQPDLIGRIPAFPEKAGTGSGHGF